ncbi:hypothetical protein F4777DRAFT_516684 [Nemania sp. FL0916]|nr:hypothetical protein F4777DRAFT_516684 [Nemania sp. FL0916]
MPTPYIPAVWRRVCAYADVSDFAALCRVTPPLYDICQTLLYNSIALDLSKKDTSPLSLLCRTLKKRSDLALCVEHLHLRLSDSNSKQAVDALAHENHTQLSIISSILKVCPNVQSFGIVHPYPLSDLTIQDFQESLFRLCRLRELEFIVQDTEWPPHIPGEADVNISVLAKAFGVSSLASVALTLQEGPDSLLPTIDLPTRTNITGLNLSECYLSMHSLDKILRALPRLTHLSLGFLWYADPVNSRVGQHLDCEILGKALMNCSSTLKSLGIAIQFESRASVDVGTGSGKGSNWGLLHTLGSLRSYRNLTSLELAPEVILGWGEEDEIQLLDVLPDSLRHLCFRLDFGTWSLSPWDFAPLAESLLCYMANRDTPALESLAMAYYEELEGEDLASLDLIKSQCRKSQTRLHLNIVPS